MELPWQSLLEKFLTIKLIYKLRWRKFKKSTKFLKNFLLLPLCNDATDPICPSIEYTIRLTRIYSHYTKSQSVHKILLHYDDTFVCKSWLHYEVNFQINFHSWNWQKRLSVSCFTTSLNQSNKFTFKLPQTESHLLVSQIVLGENNYVMALVCRPMCKRSDT